MNMQTVTIQLPKNTYERIRNAARAQKRTLENLLQDAVSAGLPLVDDLPPELAGEITAMTLLNDQALRQVAGRKIPAARQKKIDRLLDEKQAGQLNKVGQKELDILLAEVEHIILVRAQAAALLCQRGYEVGPTNHFLPSAG